MKVWVTRTEPGASRTARRLKALGHEPLVEPVLEVHPLPAAIDLGGVGALAFTSGNGLHAFAKLNPDRGLPVFTVGEATAKAAREAGFGSVMSAGGDVQALAMLIVASQSKLAGRVLFAGAVEPAGDLMGALDVAGVPARFAAVYETRPRAVQAPPDAEAVLVHSPKAAVQLARAGVDELPAYCISAAAAAPLAGWTRIRVAAEPHEDSLLGLLGG